MLLNRLTDSRLDAQCGEVFFRQLSTIRESQWHPIVVQGDRHKPYLATTFIGLL
ncbi:MAG: hypothetical protein AAFU78_08775 [Cyanobacteria bacterium J06633_2]